MNPSILVFSYYTNMPGACQAEWIDDRMFAFADKNYHITVISATCCFTHTNPNIKHIKVPALSPHGAGFEYEESKRRNIPIQKSFWYVYLYVMQLIDKGLKKIHISSGEGRWSWFFTSFLAGFRIKTIRQSSFVFTTGGPASAHLSGILLAKLFGKKVMCELQDPLSGKDIGRNKLSNAGLQFVEQLIVRFADCTIYCTRSAMEYARNRYPQQAKKIFFVYPGSNKIEEQTGFTPLKEQVNHPSINITYLGSLYQTRNMDAIMEAIQELVSDGVSIVDRLEINLYGNMNADIKQRIEDFPIPIITIHGLVNRDIAIRKAMQADVLLLIQNTDDRSIGTIPFKTYDYLHTGKLILALVYKNEELEDMMLSHGHLVCQANDVAAIKTNILGLMNNPHKLYSDIKPSNLTPQLAVKNMLTLIDTLG